MNEAKPSQPASQSVAQDAIHLYSFHNDDCRYLKRLPGWRACVRACVQAQADAPPPAAISSSQLSVRICCGDGESLESVSPERFSCSSRQHWARCSNLVYASPPVLRTTGNHTQQVQSIWCTYYAASKSANQQYAGWACNAANVPQFFGQL